MSERKVLNKYYPPDFDPSKIPRLKQARNRQYTVRMMAPFNMRCVTCGEYIYKGKKFNARKEDVENDDYLGIRIYRFYIKCTRCLQEISFKTDPKNTDYEIEAGATRNFMALKRAEEQAERELQEVKDEEANNPMKQLENRTQQSRNEIELLESLEELRDLNRRQQSVDYDSMLRQYDQHETAREREERLERQDEEYVKSLKFGNSSNKIIVSEEIIELDNQQDESNDISTSKTISDYNKKSEITEKSETNTNPTNTTKDDFLKPNKIISNNTNNWNKSIGVSKKYSIGALVKKKVDVKEEITKSIENSKILENIKGDNSKNLENIKSNEGIKTNNSKSLENTKTYALSMLGAYSDSDENSD